MTIYIDIETAAGVPDSKKLHPDFRDMIYRRYASREAELQTLRNTVEAATDKFYDAKAALFPELGRITCISLGVAVNGTLHMRSYCGQGEKDILEVFAAAVTKVKEPITWCGHYIKKFDIPYICKRMVVCGVGIPEAVNVTGKKPWETNILDTSELWAFGSGSHTSLEVLCHILEIPSPKTDMCGSETSQAFYEGRLEELIHYCEGDVIATAAVARKIIGGLEPWMFVKRSVERPVVE